MHRTHKEKPQLFWDLRPFAGSMSFWRGERGEVGVFRGERGLGGRANKGVLESAHLPCQEVISQEEFSF